MVSIKEINKPDKYLFIVDYSDCKESEMIAGAKEVGRRIREKNKRVMILSIFNDRAYVTSRFMRVVEKENRDLSHLIDKQAVVGLNRIKKMILKGFNLLLKRNVRNFGSVEDALKFLWDETTTDKEVED